MDDKLLALISHRVAQAIESSSVVVLTPGEALALLDMAQKEPEAVDEN